MKYLNTILISILLLAVFIVLKFSTLPTPSFLPNFVIDLFERPANGSKTLEALRILENLSLAYITSLIIYFLIDFIPKKRLEKKAFTICKLKLVNVYLNMSNIIGPIKMLLDLNKENRNITANELKGITKYEPHLEKTYYKNEVCLNKADSNGQTKGIFLFHKDISQYASKIRKLIDIITTLPSSGNLPIQLLNILSSIHSCEFIEKWHQSKTAPVKSSTYEIHNMDNDFYEFIQLYLALEEFDFNKHRYIYTKLNDEEITSITAEKKLIFKEVSNKLTQSEMKFIFNGIEYRVENRQLRI